MNEPKRRGRPPKNEAVDGAGPSAWPAEQFKVAEAQTYAERVWAGQSVSLSRHERVGRVRAALEAQGLSMEGVELP